MRSDEIPYASHQSLLVASLAIAPALQGLGEPKDPRSLVGLAQTVERRSFAIFNSASFDSEVNIDVTPSPESGLLSIGRAGQRIGLAFRSIQAGHGSGEGARLPTYPLTAYEKMMVAAAEAGSLLDTRFIDALLADTNLSLTGWRIATKDKLRFYFRGDEEVLGIELSLMLNDADALAGVTALSYEMKSLFRAQQFGSYTLVAPDRFAGQVYSLR